jgi:hypothetical protein
LNEGLPSASKATISPSSTMLRALLAQLGDEAREITRSSSPLRERSFTPCR